MNQETFLKDCKTLIEKDDVDALQTYYREYEEEDFAWEYIYQKLYLHACLKKKVKIVEFMKPLFQQFDPIQQIGIRQMFFYGEVLLRK